MKYILDTNICIYIINKKPAKVLRKFERYPVYDFGISSITRAELQYGVEKSENKKTIQAALDEFSRKKIGQILWGIANCIGI